MSKSKSNTGLMFKLHVFLGTGIIGHGYVYVFRNTISKPELYSLLGEPLEEGWYRLEPDNGPQLVIMNRTIQ